MSINKQLARMYQLMELNIQQKNQLGQGAFHAVYPSKTHPDRVIKVGHNADDYRFDDEEGDVTLRNVDPYHAEIFRKFPNLFPTVYKQTDKYLVLEKLNTDKIYEDNETIAEALKAVGIFREDGIEFVYYYRDKQQYMDLFSKTSCWPLIQKYLEFFERVDEFNKSGLTANKTYGGIHLDFHLHQMGYTKDGVLKLLDF